MVTDGAMSSNSSAMLTNTFRDLLAAAVDSEQAAIEADLATIPAQLSELSRRFVALDRRLPAAARRVEALRGLGAVDEFAEAELARLVDVPGVTSVEVEQGRLVVGTEPVEIRWSGTSYALGAYRLVLDLAGDVRIESVNKLGPKAAWDHPHVQDGLPCLGNLREGVLKLIAEYELALAVQVLLDFLATYQPESAYTPIENWPVAA